MTLVNKSTYHCDILEDIYISQNCLRSCLNYSSYRKTGDYTLYVIAKQRVCVCVSVSVCVCVCLCVCVKGKLSGSVRGVAGSVLSKSAIFMPITVKSECPITT